MFEKHQAAVLDSLGMPTYLDSLAALATNSHRFDTPGCSRQLLKYLLMRRLPGIGLASDSEVVGVRCRIDSSGERATQPQTPFAPLIGFATVGIDGHSFVKYEKDLRNAKA